LELVEIGTRIQTQVQSEMDRGQREWFLRQQLKAIQDELGEVDETQAEATELRERLEQAELPEHAWKQAERELQRFERLPPQAAEHGVIRTYLEWLADLPWSKATEDSLDLKDARRVLDRDHYDIETVKDRILEFLAVRKLKPDARSSILCFVGPPGVGKTSLGRSIASAMGREFERISVGGVRDESEIRGHRRTYIGAMPGTILRAVRDAGSCNPVLMIDEIDKMGADFRGDPASAMLEVLDPEQNSTFRDHYLDLRFDLSSVFFICTANQLDTVPPALRDRMELIELSGYTHEEKREIAKRYLVPRQMERNGVGRSKIEFADDALDLIVDGYTREAGVRSLEREIGSVCRKVAREFAEGSRRSKRAVRAKTIGELLGKRRIQPDAQRRTGEPGVATGLAWTPVGGDVLFVEATAFPGEGKLQVTGQLGDVMKESAAAALSWVKSLDGEPPQDWFREHDVHVHVPAGAIPKDGPSAGITMATALASRATGRPVRSDTAMTGEITLTGQVLPIGGLKEKALAAQRAGIKRLIVPRRNEPDIDDIPAHLRK
ncbi:MAG: endopeptidase La, partial [Thermoleophilaceae bacterium]